MKEFKHSSNVSRDLKVRQMDNARKTPIDKVKDIWYTSSKHKGGYRDRQKMYCMRERV